MSDSAVVIIATTGRPSLRRAVESVLDQTHEDTYCLVVVDGPQFTMAAQNVLGDTMFSRRVGLTLLPQNTGANGYVCHRIYGAMPMLVNQDYIFYLDDDNWYEPGHVRHCVAACVENDLQWCFALRNVYRNGEYVCRDECESVGMYPAWHTPGICHIDTNCFCIRRDIAVKLASRWHRSRLVDGKIQPSADTEIANYMRRRYRNHAMIPEYNVNYELGSWALSPQEDFFQQGNIEFLRQHGGKLPWA